MNGKKLTRKIEKESLRNIILSIGLIMGFVFIVSIATFYIKNNYGVSCGCSISLPVTISTLASLGVFVGVFAYYFLSKSFSKEKKEILGSVDKTLNFLDIDERTIMQKLIENDGEIAQNTLSKKTNMDVVKLHRKLSNLENKKIISKQKKGMTNQIRLTDDYKKIFINQNN